MQTVPKEEIKMSTFFEAIKRIFRKKNIYIIDIEEVNEYLKNNDIVCEKCINKISDANSISIIKIVNGKKNFYCSKCGGKE